MAYVYDRDVLAGELRFDGEVCLIIKRVMNRNILME